MRGVCNEYKLNVAILIPCYNEEITIGSVVREFRVFLPSANIYVYDNNSSDRTVEVAREAGAIVRTEPLQGKGYVVRRMFADIEADFYILVDGDATYEAAAAPRMLAMAQEQSLDMVNGARVTTSTEAYRRGHVLGNRIFTGLVACIFGRRLSDILSGYRVFSYRFVKSFAAQATGFETETEFTVHALEQDMPIGEVETAYLERPAGSASKLSTYSDGFKILVLIINLVRQERPLMFFNLLGGVFFLLGVGLGIPVVLHYFSYGVVPRLPTAILATGFVTLSALALVCGLVLDSVALGRREAKRLAYLRLPVPKGQGEGTR